MMQKIYKSFILTVLLLISTACATALKPVEYSGEPVKSDVVKTTSVELITGVINGEGATSVMSTGGVFVPIQSGSTPKLRFNEEDQKIFLESLKSEISKLDIAKVTNNAKGGVSIQLIFAQTHHSRPTQRYLLDVVMLIKDGKKVKFQKKYMIDSEKGVSFWTKMNTNADQGKKRAAEYLINELIPDIAQTFNKKL